MKIMDTVTACRDLRRRLNDGSVTVDHAHAEARILGVEARAIEGAIDAARLTGRMNNAQTFIPDTDLGEDLDAKKTK